MGKQVPTVRPLPRMLPTTRATGGTDATEAPRRTTVLVLPTDATPDGLLESLEALGQDAVGQQLMPNGRIAEADAVAKTTLTPVLPTLPLRV